MNVPEVYPLRASTDYAGAHCLDKKCPNYARFAVTPLTDHPEKLIVCGHHLSTYIKGIEVLQGVACVVQEVPGNWPASVIGTQDGTLVTASARDLKRANGALGRP